jgi:nucleoside-diphosphate-sugar epimerase
MFGQGTTRLQLVHVEDVAEAIMRALQPGAIRATAYELGGPRVYDYKDLINLIADRLHKRRILFPTPFPIWHALAAITEMVPGAPLSRSQVELMETDTIVATEMPGFDALGISPKPLEAALEEIIAKA